MYLSTTWTETMREIFQGLCPLHFRWTQGTGLGDDSSWKNTKWKFTNTNPVSSSGLSPRCFPPNSMVHLWPAFCLSFRLQWFAGLVICLRGENRPLFSCQALFPDNPPCLVLKLFESGSLDGTTASLDTWSPNQIIGSARHLLLLSYTHLVPKQKRTEKRMMKRITLPSTKLPVLSLCLSYC